MSATTQNHDKELAQLLIDFGIITNEIATMKENHFIRYRAAKVTQLGLKKSKILEQICAQIKHVSPEVRDKIKKLMYDKFSVYLP